jgi:hypothetical protein
VTDAFDVGSALARAVRVTYGRLGTTLGATYRSPIILPHAEPEQLDPVTLHSTTFSSVPVTVAVTTCEPPVGICRLPGAEMLTTIPDFDFVTEVTEAQLRVVVRITDKEKIRIETQAGRYCFH